MKHNTEIKEVVHNIELTDTELVYLKTICKEYLILKQGLPGTLCEIKLAKEILGIDKENTLPTMTHVKMEEVTDKEKVEKDLDIITTATSRASELLDMKGILIGEKDLIDPEDNYTGDFIYNAIIGKQGQLGIKTQLDPRLTFFNSYCATLIQDFIETKGQARYHGYAATNKGSYRELNIYIDNKGAATDPEFVGVNKSIDLKYYSNGNVNIIKNDDFKTQMMLTAEQAAILVKFIKRHF